MSFKSSSLLCIALLLACSSAIYGFDITKMLEKEPEFSTFNKYITEAKLADQINSRNTITVLALDNNAISSISGKSPEAIKAIISTHVLLDFYDDKKLVEAQGSSLSLTTLYQSSGLALKQQGFVNVSLVGEGEIAFSSVGSSDYSELVRTVTSEPYNISILEVTKPIIPVGLDSQTPSAQSPQQAKASPPPKQSAKAPAKTAEAPAKTAEAPAKTAEAPTSVKDAKSPSPAKTADAPAPSNASAAPSPSETAAESPLEDAEAPTTAAEGPVADEDGAADTAESSSSTIKMGLAGAVVAFASFFIAM